MTLPTITGFISMWDFHNATEPYNAHFEQQAEYFPHNHAWHEEDVKAAIRHVQAVVCSPQFPVNQTGPTALVTSALELIFRGINDNAAYYEEYRSFLLGCLAAGPSLAHMDIMTTVISESQFDDYVKGLSGEKLTSFLESLKMKFANNQTLTKDYCSKLSKVLGSKIMRRFTKDQFAAHRGAFVRLLMFYQLQLPEADEHVVYLYYTSLISAIESLMGRDKWKDLEVEVPDPAPFCFKEQLSAFGNVLKAEKYPAFEKQKDVFKYSLQNILDPIVLNKTYFGLNLDAVMELFCIVAKCPYSEDQEKLMGRFRSFVSGIRKNDLVKNKPELFEKYAPMLTNLVLDIPHPDCLGEVIKDIHEYFLTPASAGKPSHFRLWTNFLAALLTQPDVRYVESCKRYLENNKKMLKWKENTEGARLILTNVGDVKLKQGDDTRNASPYNVQRAQESLVEELFKQLKFYKVLGDVQKDILGLIQQILEDEDEDKLSIARRCAEYIELKEDLRLALPLIDTFDRKFKSEDFPWSHPSCACMCKDILTKVIQAHKDQDQFKPFAPKFVSVFKTAMSRDFYDYEADRQTVFAYVLRHSIYALASLYCNSKNQDGFRPLLGEMVRLLRCDDEDVARGMVDTFSILSRANPDLFAPHMKEIVEVMLEKEDKSLLRVVQAGYKKNPKPVNDVFNKIWDLLGSIEANYKSQVLSFLNEIAELNPKPFSKKHVDILFGEYIDTQFTQHAVYQLLQTLSRSKPELLEARIDNLSGRMDTLHGVSLITTIFTNMVHKNKKLTRRVFDILIKYVKTCKEDYTHIVTPLSAIRTMGMEDREILKPHKQLFENIAKKYPNLKDFCGIFIDIIEGRSIEDIRDRISQLEEDVGGLDTRVTNTESDVKEMGQEVDSQGRKIGQLKTDVVKQEERIDELEEVVDDTVEKVEEIDKKTLSNAPAWSRDVSILLNPDAEHDWRLLAQRLGYCPEDIRGWATQHDPCMSLLSEWFATHKTSEATKAVLKNLEEMNRLDAAEIVGRAMQAVENVVKDEPLDYETPPPIFISYQWGHQPEVRLLRKHLEMAGFESWMDIGQMGGGDKLYAKIDQGIRAAKAVICCVTEKYAKSPNCNREVNLAVNLGKPIIPLLMENVAWPPPGAMGPIFGEYLYIRFFQGGKEDETKDDRVWPPLSFQELLMQLSYMKLIPEQSKIAKPYKNWWLPPEEVIVVKKKPTADGRNSQTARKSVENKKEISQPEVFISYQWGIQPQVKALYKRMSGLGYHCWMDIHQMGGGDSLYDKIDRGVRGSKVVVSCVTEKYSKSANCRREVSLADALKKPIIPLLLEDTTWPPSGPMSMVFTQLLYIDFKDEKIRKSWTGSPFDEFLSKIESYTSNRRDSVSTGNGGKEKQDKKPDLAAQQKVKQKTVNKGDSAEQMSQTTSGNEQRDKEAASVRKMQAEQKISRGRDSMTAGKDVERNQGKTPDKATKHGTNQNAVNEESSVKETSQAISGNEHREKKSIPVSKMQSHENTSGPISQSSHANKSTEIQAIPANQPTHNQVVQQTPIPMQSQLYSSRMPQQNQYYSPIPQQNQNYPPMPQQNQYHSPIPQQNQYYHSPTPQQYQYQSQIPQHSHYYQPPTHQPIQQHQHHQQTAHPNQHQHQQQTAHPNQHQHQQQTAHPNQHQHTPASHGEDKSKSCTLL